MTTTIDKTSPAIPVSMFLARLQQVNAENVQLMKKAVADSTTRWLEDDPMYFMRRMHEEVKAACRIRLFKSYINWMEELLHADANVTITYADLEKTINRELIDKAASISSTSTCEMSNTLERTYVSILADNMRGWSGTLTSCFDHCVRRIEFARTEANRAKTKWYVRCKPGTYVNSAINGFTSDEGKAALCAWDSEDLEQALKLAKSKFRSLEVVPVNPNWNDQ